MVGIWKALALRKYCLRRCCHVRPAARIQERTDATYISPCNDAAVMSGQGTMALELLEQARALHVG